MRRTYRLVLVLLAAWLATGCVERRYVITTDPPGAVVLRNGQPIGQTPVDDHFVYYGTYHYTVIKEGYETLQVDQKIPAPWYEYIGLDFISENLFPFQLEDVRHFHYKLEPRHIVNPNQLLDAAHNLRNRGMSLGGGSTGAPPATTPPTPAPPPPPGAAPVLPAPQGVAPAPAAPPR